MVIYSEFKEGNFVIIINNTNNSGDFLGIINHINENQSMQVFVKDINRHLAVDKSLCKCVYLSKFVLESNFESEVINEKSYYKKVTSKNEELLISFINPDKILKNRVEMNIHFEFIHELQNWYSEQFDEPINLNLTLGVNC